jgi:hypothetical protein
MIDDYRPTQCATATNNVRQCPPVATGGQRRPPANFLPPGILLNWPGFALALIGFNRSPDRFAITLEMAGLPTRPSNRYGRESSTCTTAALRRDASLRTLPRFPMSMLSVDGESYPSGQYKPRYAQALAGVSRGPPVPSRVESRQRTSTSVMPAKPSVTPARPSEEVVAEAKSIPDSYSVTTLRISFIDHI